MGQDKKDFSNIEILHETFNNIFNMRYTWQILFYGST